MTVAPKDVISGQWRQLLDSTGTAHSIGDVITATPQAVAGGGANRSSPVAAWCTGCYADEYERYLVLAQGGDADWVGNAAVSYDPITTQHWSTLAPDTLNLYPTTGPAQSQPTPQNGASVYQGVTKLQTAITDTNTGWVITLQDVSQFASSGYALLQTDGSSSSATVEKIQYGSLNTANKTITITARGVEASGYGPARTHVVGENVIPSRSGVNTIETYTDSLGLYGPVGSLWPGSRHGYCGMVWMRSVKRAWLAGGQVWFRSYTTDTWEFDPAITAVAGSATPWARQSSDPLQDGFNGLHGCWDLQKNRVLYQGATALWSYDPTKTAGTRYTRLSALQTTGTLDSTYCLFDERRRRFVRAGLGGNAAKTAYGISYYQLDVPGQTAEAAQTLGLVDLPGNAFATIPKGQYDRGNWARDPIGDKYVWYPGTGTAVYYVDPDTGTVTNDSGTGGDTPPSIQSYPANHLRYLESQDVFIYLSEETSNGGNTVYCFRPGYRTGKPTALPIQFWKAFPYPAHNSDGSKVNQSDGVKHTTSVTDESRGIVVIANGDSVATLGSFSQSLDSSTGLGSFNMQTGTWGWIKRIAYTAGLNTEPEPERSDNGPLGWIPPNSGTLLDDKYFWIPGFMGASQATSNTRDGTNSALTALGDLLTANTSGACLTIPSGGTFVGTLICEQSNNNGSTWTPSTFYDFDTGTNSSSLLVTSPNTQLYRSINNAIGSITQTRVRVSSYTSGSASGCVIAGGETLDGFTNPAGYGPSAHGKPVAIDTYVPAGLQENVEVFDPAASSPSGLGKWVTTPAIGAAYSGDGTNTGQGRYDPTTRKFWHLAMVAGSISVVSLNCVTGLYDSVTSISSLMPYQDNQHRDRLPVDRWGRRAFMICPQSASPASAKLGFINLDTLTTGFASATAIPNWLPKLSGGMHQFMDFDPLNRIVMIPITQDMGGAVYNFSIYHVDTDVWETFPVTSTDFPTGILGNECCYDTYHNGFLVYGGSVNVGPAGAVFRYRGGPTTAAPVVVPALSSLSPSSGPVGTLVTVAGTNFLSITGTLNWDSAGIAVQSWANTQITFLVPASAGLGAHTVGVVTSGGTSNSLSFTVTTPPSITKGILSGSFLKARSSQGRRVGG